LAHKNRTGDLGELIEIIADMALGQIEKKTFSSSPEGLRYDKPPHGANEVEFEKPKASNKTEAVKTGQIQIPRDESRFIPIQVRRIVWSRDKGKCQYVDPLTKRKCESKHGIQVDHVRAFSKGGSNAAHNLQLLCRAHNSFKGSGAPMN